MTNQFFRNKQTANNGDRAPTFYELLRPWLDAIVSGGVCSHKWRGVGGGGGVVKSYTTATTCGGRHACDHKKTGCRRACSEL